MARLIKDKDGNLTFKATEYVVKSDLLKEIAVDLTQKRPSLAPALRARIALFLSELRRKALHVNGGSFQIGDGMLRDYIGTHHAYPVLRILRDRGVLIKVYSKMVGKRCAGYRICDALLMSKNAEYVLESGSVEARKVSEVLSKVSAFHCRGRDEMHKAYADGLTKFRFDSTECREVLSGHPGIVPGSVRWIGQAMSIRDFNETTGSSGRFVRLHVGDTGRVYHPACNLKECVRKRAFVSVKGDEARCRSFDIRASQPTVLAALLMQASGRVPSSDVLSSPEAVARLEKAGGTLLEGSDILDHAEVRRFVEIVESGDIYEYLCNMSQKLDDGWRPTRSNCKVAFLRDVIAKKGSYTPRTVERAFMVNFPTIHTYIRSVNKGRHQRLVRMLQWAESEIVLRNIWKRVTEETSTPIMTVHDSFYVHPEAAESLVLTTQEVSDKIGVRLTLVEAVDDKAVAIERRNTLESVRSLLNG